MFWFTVPFGVVEDREQLLEAEVKALRLLIVDDNATNRTILTRQATAWGMASDEAENGPEALEMLRSAAAASHPYDVAILDLMMPGMDGIELANAISADPALSSTRKIMLASSVTRRRDAEAADIGAYLTKPARRSLLYNAVANATAERVSERPAAPVRPPVTRGRVLVVEDNPVNQAVAEGMLARRGYGVDIAQNGREAVDTVFQAPYVAVLMDCQMPEMDGYQATEEIRRREGSDGHVPIIAMTAHSLKGDRERCIAAGMDDYVPKPLQGEALDAALARCAAAPLDGNGDEAVDAETIERLRAELEGIGRAGAVDGLVEEFVSSLGERVQEIRSALAKGDAEVVRESAHALKGAAATLGATRLAAACAAMERAGRDGDLEHARDLIVDLTEAAEATESGLSRALQIGLQASQ